MTESTNSARLLLFGLFISLSCFAQSVYNGTPVTCDTTSCTYSLTFENGAPDSPAVITGAPWSGQRESRYTDGGLLRPPQPMVYRDSQGRVRTERRFSLSRSLAADQNASEALFIEIRDPVAGYRYVLDPVLRVAHRTPYHPEPTVKFAPNRPDAFTTIDPEGNTTTGEPIGSIQISGVSVNGFRTARRAPATASGSDGVTLSYSESWTDPENGIGVLFKSTDSAGTMRETRIADYSHAEPDPALFRIPDGYQIVDETGPFEVVHPYHGEPGNNGARQASVTGPTLRESCDDRLCAIAFTPANGRVYTLTTGAAWSGTLVIEGLARKLADGTTAPGRPGLTRTTWRDTDGRTKVVPADFTGSGGIEFPDPRIQEIDDPIAGCRYLIDTVNRVVYKIPMKYAKTPYRDREPQTLQNQTAIEDLHDRTVSGVQAWGYLVTLTAPAITSADKPAITTIETWTDHKTGVGLLMIRKGPEGDFRYAVRDYKQGNPDPSEFQPPADYKLIDENGSFSFSIPRPQ